MIRRAQLCIDAGGNHFHHLLWWYILSAFGYCINFCIHAMLRTRANFSWSTLYMSVRRLRKLYVPFSSFNQKWIFSTDISKIPIYNFKEICPVWAKVFHADGNTDPTKLVLVYHNCFLKTLQKLHQFRFSSICQVAADLRSTQFVLSYCVIFRQQRFLLQYVHLTSSKLHAAVINGWWH